MTVQYSAKDLKSRLLESSTKDQLDLIRTPEKVALSEKVSHEGFFDLDYSFGLIRVCVWDGGVVEIHSIGWNGDTREIETLDGVPVDVAVERVWAHHQRVS